MTEEDDSTSDDETTAQITGPEGAGDRVVSQQHFATYEEADAWACDGNKRYDLLEQLRAIVPRGIGWQTYEHGISPAEARARAMLRDAVDALEAAREGEEPPEPKVTPASNRGEMYLRAVDIVDAWGSRWQELRTEPVEDGTEPRPPFRSEIASRLQWCARSCLRDLVTHVDRSWVPEGSDGSAECDRLAELLPHWVWAGPQGGQHNAAGLLAKLNANIGAMGLGAGEDLVTANRKAIEEGAKRARRR